MRPPSSDVLRGTLDLPILETLTLEPMHGWGIGQRIQQMSRGVLDANQGSLDGNPVQVVGVMPASFAFPSEQVDLWQPR